MESLMYCIWIQFKVTRYKTQTNANKTCQFKKNGTGIHVHLKKADLQKFSKFSEQFYK